LLYAFGSFVFRKELEVAARYAQQRGVLIAAAASPDWPPGSEEERYVKNNCRVAPGELPGVMTVSATGPVGYPDYDLWIAGYSSVGMSRVDVTAPGGDYFQATGTVQDAVLGAITSTSDPDYGLWDMFDPLNVVFPGITVIRQPAVAGPFKDLPDLPCQVGRGREPAAPPPRLLGCQSRVDRS
jgi:hypothetical protein